jgi:hypothetical protein
MPIEISPAAFDTLLPVLRIENPVTVDSSCRQFTTLWARGVDEKTFWEMFVQCGLCRMVMPKDVFASTHGPLGCQVEREGIAWPMDEDADEDEIQRWSVDAASLSGDTEIVDWDDDDTDDEVSILRASCLLLLTPL